jgi:hypothetical protein
MPARIAFALTALTAALAPARADFIIDTFANPTPATTYSLGTNPGSTFTATDALGGGVTRTTTVTLLANGFFSSAPANGEIGTTAGFGRLSLNTASGATATAGLKYAYTAPKNFAAAGGEIRFTFSFADQNVPISVRLSDGTSTAVAVQAYSGSGPYAVGLGSFTGVDLTRVSSVELVLNRDLTNPNPGGGALTSADLTLTGGGVFPAAPSPVPAPPAILLGLLAAAALGAARVVRRRAAY